MILQKILDDLRCDIQYIREKLSAVGRSIDMLQIEVYLHLLGCAGHDSLQSIEGRISKQPPESQFSCRYYSRSYLRALGLRYSE